MNIPTFADPRFWTVTYCRRPPRSTFFKECSGRSHGVHSRNQKNGASKRANTYRWKPFTCSRTTDTHAFIQTYASMHRRARFYWCRERVTWRDLVLTDDSRFCLYVSDFRLCVRCKLEEYIHSLHTGTSHGIMAWSIMSYNTCSSLVLEDGTLNSPMYI